MREGVWFSFLPSFSLYFYLRHFRRWSGIGLLIRFEWFSFIYDTFSLVLISVSRYLFIILSTMEQKNFEVIQQLRLKFSHDYAPYKHFNPYQLLDQLNKAVKGKHDIHFVHVRYILTKNRTQRELNDRMFNEKEFNIDREFNNIMSCAKEGPGDDFLKNFLFKDAVTLSANSEETTTFERDMEKEIVEEEERKLEEIEKSVKEIMMIYNGTHQGDRSTIRSIEGFQNQTNKDYFSQNEYEIYAKGLMNQPTIEKLKSQKNEKKPLEITTKGVTMKIHLHPTDVVENVDRLSKERPITGWGLSAIYETLSTEANSPEKKKEDSQVQYTEYFTTEDLQKKVGKINTSVKIVSTVTVNKNAHDKPQSINITSLLWNQIVLRVVVKLSQIKKIEKASSQNANKKQYYFYLTYPPMYYITHLKKEESNDISFLKSWDRVQNFVLLQNNHINQNYFLRYFLFNNTILTIDLTEDVASGLFIAKAEEDLQRVFQQMHKTIPTEHLDTFWKRTFSFKKLKQEMDDSRFRTKKKNLQSKSIEDKLWTIKYLLLVMVRANYLLPQAQQMDIVLNAIEENMDDIDCYLYVLWRTATNMWGYRDQSKRFYKYLLEESQNMKSNKKKNKNLIQSITKPFETITYIFRVSLTPSGYLINPPTPEMKGRVIKHYSKESDFFLRVSFNDESEIELKNQKYITKRVFRKCMNEIQILERKYIPLGWSPSQLRSFSLWYFCEIGERPDIQQLKRDYILGFLGNFQHIDNPAKRAARIGQNFSASWTFDGSKMEVGQIDDEYSETGHLYTDGIGKISGFLLEKISLKLQINELSIIQMRYKGAKGVLALDSSLKNYEVKLRKSMIKFTCSHDDTNKYLDILDWNKYKAGFLNRQIIILLRTLGIEDSVFMGLQEEHIKGISQMTFKDCSIFKHMGDDVNNDINNLESANKTILDLLKAGFVLEQEPFFRGVLETLKKNGYNQLKVKSNIKVEKSARIIGIIDEHRILEEDEIYCGVYDQFQKNPQRFIVQGEAIITRNPCLDPADIRKVTCISAKQIERRFENQGKKNQFEKFINCVIFPMKGKYPLTSQISGSDLDGDNFFICWDKRLIPKTVLDPHLIDEAPKKDANKEAKTNNISYDQMLDFFIDYVNYEKLGQIDNSHLVHADQDENNFANNKKCQKLAEIHGKAVDFPKSGYCPPVSHDLFASQFPDFMEKENNKTYTSKSILGKLYRDVKEKIQDLLEAKDHAKPSIDPHLIAEYKFQQTEKEVTECINLLRQYEREISNLIHLTGVDSEFEIYSGNFSIVKDKVKAFGKNRLIATIVGLRKRFFDKFFENLPERDRQVYANAFEDDAHRLEKNIFQDQTMQKAQLYYLVSYIYRFDSLEHPHPKFKELQDQVESYRMKRTMNRNSEFCGFVWFVIPRVIINLKISNRLPTLPDQEEQDEKEKPKMEEKPSGDDDDEYI